MDLQIDLPWMPDGVFNIAIFLLGDGEGLTTLSLVRLLAHVTIAMDIYFRGSEALCVNFFAIMNIRAGQMLLTTTYTH